MWSLTIEESQMVLGVFLFSNTLPESEKAPVLLGGHLANLTLAWGFMETEPVSAFSSSCCGSYFLLKP